MNERLKLLRTTLKKTLREVAIDLNMTDSYFSILETGKRELNDRIIQLVCLTYNVNESWLRFGKGEMFRQPIEPPKLEQRDIIIRFIQTTFNQLNPETQKILLDAFEKIHNEQNQSVKQ